MIQVHQAAFGRELFQLPCSRPKPSDGGRRPIRSDGALRSMLLDAFFPIRLASSQLAAWWASRRPAPDSRLTEEIDALKGRVQTLESSILEILRTVQEALEAERTEAAPAERGSEGTSPAERESGAADVADAGAPVLTPAEMWALTPEMWADTPAEAPVVAPGTRAETPVRIWTPAPAVPVEPHIAPPAIPADGPARAEAVAPENAGRSPFRGPGADRDLSLPSPSTSDGRELARIRKAVLRLTEEGWRPETISEKLRLGAGDINLILKTDLLRPKAGHAELVHTRR
jgi:hypothetical protein